MQVEQQQWTEAAGWASSAVKRCEGADLVLAFGETTRIGDPSLWAELRSKWPRARLVGCSTAGEIADTVVRDGSVVATAFELDSSRVMCSSVRLSDVRDGLAAGNRLAAQLDTHGLRHVFVLSDGLNVNGSELVRGLTEVLPKDVAVTGGLSGDGSRFGRTLVGLDHAPNDARVVAVGLYGSLKVGFGSLGGWDPFGPERLVTRSQGAVLFELDGQPALELYKRYLGEHASRLPSSGLLFPLTVRCGDDPGVVRTILAVDEQNQSMTFAGDVPRGAHARLMRANVDRLVDGAVGAALACQARGAEAPDAAILVSCVGRKLVLQQRVEEEVDVVRDVLGKRPVLAGFYSYGEISPLLPSGRGELHNQTMTITTLRED